MKSILVTGGSGFIGSHTCLLLLEKGFEIFVIDSFANSSPKSIQKVCLILNQKDIFLKEKIHIFKGDIKNQSDIESVFQMSYKLDKRIDAVIHFAGLKSVSDSITNPISYWENNVLGTINLYTKCPIQSFFTCSNLNYILYY